MGPEEIAASLAGDDHAHLKNVTTFCFALGRSSSRGVFSNSNPLAFPFPLLLAQMSVASSTILLVSALLKPLGQPIVVRQLVGGILIGPSALGRFNLFSKWIFPQKGYMMLDTMSSFALIFYTLLIGVQIDPWILKRLERRGYVIGFFTVAVPMALTAAACVLIRRNFDLGQTLAKSLPAVGQTESVLAFPMIAQFLAELNMLNSEFGRVALSSAMISGFCSASGMIPSILWHDAVGDRIMVLETLSNSAILTAVILFVIRPVLMRTMNDHPQGESLNNSQIASVLVAAATTGFLSDALGLHTYMGPLFLGISLPAGPPIGSSLVDKLDLIVTSIFMPTYFVKLGLLINISTLKLKNYLIVQFIAFIGAIGKFLGAFLVALCYRIPVSDAASLGLVFNFQGFLELGLFKMMERSKAIDNQSYVIMCISLVFILGTVTPLIKYLYDPSRRFMVYTKRAVINSRPNTELRVLVCIHENENIPATINLLEALNPTKRSPLSVFAVHLIELLGHANPVLITHKLNGMPTVEAKTSEPVLNAIRYFEHNNHNLVKVHPFTSISPATTMNADVCIIALEKMTSLIIVPFYKRYQPSGEVDSYNRTIKITNQHVLHKAPCSVAILVDRDLMKTSKPILDNRASYRVAILFLGGDDDREALAIAARVAGCPNISLTIIRLVENGNISSGGASERRLDNVAVSEYRTALAGNYRVTYIEEVVMDGSGTVSIITSMEDQYELVIVGRRHGNRSGLLSGLMDWDNDKELGTIGGTLASSQFMHNTTVLVVQQHTNIVNAGPHDTSIQQV